MSSILFINPSAAKSHGTNLWASKATRIMAGEKMMVLPVLSGMILAALTPEHHTFTYLDEEIEDIDYYADIDIVALTAMTQQSERAYQIAEDFRKLGKTVVIGGIHATIMREEAAGHCDAILCGEGENIWQAFLKDYDNGAVKSVYDAKDYPPVTTLTSPRVDVINHKRYSYFPIQATKGCPYHCDFCSIQHSSGHRYRMKPVQQVVDEILAYEQYNQPIFAGVFKKGYYFVDDNLYVNREYVKELMIALAPLNIRWDAQGTCNLAKDDEILSLMAASGCRSLTIGFESITPASLKEANKPSVNKIEEYETLIHNILKHGIVPGGYFVFGFDSDDVHVFERTVAFIRESGLLEPTISILTPYVGTALYERIKDRIVNTSCNFYNSWSAVFTPKQMTADELFMGARWAGQQTTDLKLARKNLEKFWRMGPWEKNPRLSAKQRIALIILSVLMGLHGFRSYRQYLFWAATRKNAVDFVSIIWFLRRCELSNSVQGARNPASARRSEINLNGGETHE